MTWLINFLAKLFSREQTSPVVSTDNNPHIEVTVVPTEPTIAPVVPVAETLSFLTPKLAWHAVRVLCDRANLTLNEKNLLCACIFQESRFNNEAVGRNATSTDWGIIQLNDHYHIGVGKEFPSVKYVLENPDKAVEWMIAQYKAGRLSMWVSYTSQAYLQWLSPSSPMWNLAK